MTPKVKLPVPTAIVRDVYALFLLSTGIMTYVGAVKGIPMGSGPESPPGGFAALVVQLVGTAYGVVNAPPSTSARGSHGAGPPPR